MRKCGVNEEIVMVRDIGYIVAKNKIGKPRLSGIKAKIMMMKNKKIT